MGHAPNNAIERSVMRGHVRPLNAGVRRIEMRVLALILVFSCFAVGARADEDPWLEVFADHYELDGNRYDTKAQLVVALRKARNREVLWLRWSAYATETEKLAAIDARIKEATQAAKEAGIARVREISAEVF